MAWGQVYTIPFDKTSYQFHLHGFSDMQIGSDQTSLRKIQYRVDEIISDPIDSGVVILGDIEDDDRPSTRALKGSAFADRPEVLESASRDHMHWLDKFVVPILLPLQQTKFGIMGIIAGHHWMQLTPAINSVQYICNRIKELTKREVPYLGEMSAFMDFRFRHREGHGLSSMGHIQHGEGGGQTKGSTVQRLERTMQGFEADWYIRAHDCQQLSFKSDRLRLKKAKEGDAPAISADTKVCLNLGAATQGYTMNKKASYVEKGMMRPTTMGWGSLYFTIRKSRKHEDPSYNDKIEIKAVI